MEKEREGEAMKKKKASKRVKRALRRISKSDVVSGELLIKSIHDDLAMLKNEGTEMRTKRLKRLMSMLTQWEKSLVEGVD